MTGPIITLTTDFGQGSPYVAAMKAVILGVNPEAQIVDLTHLVKPQDIREAAIILADVTPLFPTGSIHIAVVDPGVGSARAILYAEVGDQRYICPDNGLLSRLAKPELPPKLVAITNQQWFRQPISRTFHGRDIMAPAAAHLSLGLDPSKLGPPQTGLVQLEWPGAGKVADSTGGSQRIEGVVESIDSYGNLGTNISREMLADAPTDDTVVITCDEHETRGIFGAYADQPAMTLIALIGSNDRLELAIVDDNAQIMLGVQVGAKVEVTW